MSTKDLSYERFYPNGVVLDDVKKFSSIDQPTAIAYVHYRTLGNASVHKHQRRSRATRTSKVPINVGCYQPSTSIAIDYTGRCFVCNCPAWVPYPIGNILEFESFEEVWNHPIAKKIQANTQPGSTYKFCNTVVCGVEDAEAYQYVYHPDVDIEQILEGQGRLKDIKPLGPALPGGYVTPNNLHRMNPYFINIAIDDSCNLQCATCRIGMIHHNNKGKLYEYKKQLANHILKLLDRFEENTVVQIGGDGEIFSSKVYSDIIYDYKPKANHMFILKTNATLISSRIRKSQIMRQLDGFTISIDAGSKETYERVRYPAKWSAIIKSLDLLKNVLGLVRVGRQAYSLFSLNFVLHRENMHDIINFMDLCKHYMVTGTVQAIQNWGTYGDEPVKSLVGSVIQVEPHPFLEQRVHLKGDIHFDEWTLIANRVREHNYYHNIRIENEILTQL